jgi:hypothetical protein
MKLSKKVAKKMKHFFESGTADKIISCYEIWDMAGILK